MEKTYEQIENAVLSNDYQQAKTLIKQLKNKYVSDLLSEIAEIEAVYKQIGEVGCLYQQGFMNESCFEITNKKVNKELIRRKQKFVSKIDNIKQDK